MNFDNLKYTPVGSAQSVAYTAAAGSTSNFTEGEAVLVWATTAAHIVVGPGVTATVSNGTPIPPNVLCVLPTGRKEGTTYRVSAIQATAGGTVYARALSINTID